MQHLKQTVCESRKASLPRRRFFRGVTDMLCMPQPHMLNSIKAWDKPQHIWVAELVDNALDANARCVSIKFNGKHIQVCDDGHGIENLPSALSFGGHNGDLSKSDKLGRYGIGLPYTIIWWSGEFAIDTVFEGVRHTISADFFDVGKDWSLPDPSRKRTDDPSGTIITIRSTRPTIQRSNIERELAWMFAPAINAGVVLRSGEGKLYGMRPTNLPAIDNGGVTGTVNIADGRAIKYTAGKLKKALPVTGGPVWISYSHRRILKCDAGMSDFVVPYFGADVELLGNWELETNKSEISDDQYDELDAALQPIFEPLLRDLSMDSETINLRDVADQLNKQAREKRAKGETTGTASSTNTGKRRTRARKYDTKQHGSVELENGDQVYSGPQLSFTFTAYDNQDAGIFEPRKSRVVLNSNNRLIAALVKEKAKSLETLWAIAFGLVAPHHKADGWLFSDVNSSPEATLGVLLNTLERAKR